MSVTNSPAGQDLTPLTLILPFSVPSDEICEELSSTNLVRKVQKSHKIAFEVAKGDSPGEARTHNPGIAQSYQY